MSSGLLQGADLKKAYINNRKGITIGLYSTLIASFGLRLYRNFNTSDESAVNARKKVTRKVAIDVNFLRQLGKLLKIAFPKYFSLNSVLVVVQAACLVARTYLSLQVAKLDGKITSHLVRGEGRKFLKSLGMWLLIGIPASGINAAIQFIRKSVALQIRTNVTDYCLDRYLGENKQRPVYYRIQMGTSSGVNVGQLMVADTAKLCSTLPRLYSNLAKPVLDVAVYTYQLSQNIGADNVFFLGVAIQMSARFLRLAAPPFGEFVASEAKLEGDFRQGHTRLIEYAEEIAFYSGDKLERQRLDGVFRSLVRHVERVLDHRLTYSSLEDFVIKYLWGAAGLILCSVPIFGGFSDINTRAQNYVVNRKLLLLSSDAIGRLMASYKEISSLAGIVSRVAGFVDELDMESQDPVQSHEKSIENQSSANVTIGNYVEFSHVPIVSPGGEILVDDVTFRIDPGHHLLVVGPNGCGKSSLFRILGGIWPLEGGNVVRPDGRDMFYIPQRPYLSHGSLRQQIIYPQSEEDFKGTDKDLLDILKILGLDAMVDSEENGLDTVRVWRDDLSMGAQQKVAAARLFYHKPKFAILDECTASVTLDTETTIYTHAKSLGISLLTVSHRTSLWQYHDKILQFDGHGGYFFGDLNPSERLALEEEKLKLDSQLRQVDAMRERLSALVQEKVRRESHNISRQSSPLNLPSISQE